MNLVYPSPYFLIQKEKGIFSYFGLSIIIIAFFIFLIDIFYWSDFFKIKAFMYKENPTINEKSYDITDFSPSIIINEEFNFTFSVKSVVKNNSNFFLDNTYFTPELVLYKVKIDDNQYFEDKATNFTLENHTNETTNFTFFNISKDDFTLIDKKNRTITICPDTRTHLKLFLKPCEKNEGKECKSQSEIDKALSEVKVYIKYNTGLKKYDNKTKEHLSVYDSEVYEINKASNLLRTEVDFFFEHVETTMNDPFYYFHFSLESRDNIPHSFFHVRDEKTIFSYFNRSFSEDRKNNTFFVASFSYDKRVGNNDTHTFYKIKGKKINIYYKTFPELYSEIFSIFLTAFSLVSIVINYLFGYFDGNYYSKIIKSLFRFKEDKEDNHKRIIKLRFKNEKSTDEEEADTSLNQPMIGESIEIYGKSRFRYISCGCEDCNSTTNRICNNISTGCIINLFKSKDKKEKEDQKIKEDSKCCDKCFNGCCVKCCCEDCIGCCNKYYYPCCNIIKIIIISIIILGVVIILGYWVFINEIYIIPISILIALFIVICLTCWYKFKEQEKCYSPSNIQFFDQAREIVTKYIDITYMTQKLFQFDQLIMNKEYNYISKNATIINGFHLNTNSYKNWISQQKDKNIEMYDVINNVSQTEDNNMKEGSI